VGEYDRPAEEPQLHDELPPVGAPICTKQYGPSMHCFIGYISERRTGLTIRLAHLFNGRRRMPDCQECDYLREEYGNAVFDYVRLDSRMKMAVLRNEVEALAELTNRVEAAVARRDLALQRFREHKTTHPLVATAS